MLSTYKPVINSTSLISDLKEVEETVARALNYFNITRHIVLYYEDLVGNRTVSGYKLVGNFHSFHNEFTVLPCIQPF